MLSDRPARVLVLTSTFPRWQSDTEPRFVLDLCERLAECFHVTVLAPSAKSAATNEWMGKVRDVRYRYDPLKSWERLSAPGSIIPICLQQQLLALLVPLLIVCQF